MTAKTEIVERLGEKAILLPSLLGNALAANDHIKQRLSLLQDAAARAQASEEAKRGIPSDGFDKGEDPTVSSMKAGARLLGPSRVLLPGVAAVLGDLRRDLAAMLAPLETQGAEEAGALGGRAAALEPAIPRAEGDQLDLHDIAALTTVNPAQGDSLHLLVMDIHKALNRLMAETALEDIDGAQVHGLNASDRRAVQAFMRGLHRTAALAFGHPGLATTAVRAGDRLAIQNDIGITDVHVIVIHVAGGEVTITYTDNHRPRAKFFMALLATEGLEWSPLSEQSAKGIGEEDIFYLLTGTYRGADENSIDRFLEFAGSRIVFLIDWNKARKALQAFVDRTAALDLLAWAASHDYGHRAFLVLGGAELIFQAVHRVAAGRLSYGARLDEVLGEAECLEFLRSVLRDTSEGLAAGRTARLIRDEIHADLSHRFESAESAVLTVLVRHLGLSRGLAAGIDDMLSEPHPASRARRSAFAVRAKQIEAKADRLTVVARELAGRLRDAGVLRIVIEEIENATDALEDAAFFLSLPPDSDVPQEESTPLTRLSGIALESVSQLVRALEAASRLPSGKRADAVTALEAIDAVMIAERDADTAERENIAALVDAPASTRSFVLWLEIVRKLEKATDHLSHAALALRDRVMEELSA